MTYTSGILRKKDYFNPGFGISWQYQVSTPVMSYGIQA